MAKSIMSMSVGKRSTERIYALMWYWKQEETKIIAFHLLRLENINAMSNELLESILIQRYEQLKTWILMKLLWKNLQIQENVK